MEQILPTVMHAGEAVVTFLNGVPAEYYAVILASLPFSLAVAFGKSFLQRKWDKQPSEVKMFLTNMAGLFLMAVAAYLETTPTTDPYIAIGSLVGFTTVVQQPFFFKVVKPAITLFWETWDRGKALNEELKTATVPAEGLPVEQ